MDEIYGNTKYFYEEPTLTKEQLIDLYNEILYRYSDIYNGNSLTDEFSMDQLVQIYIAYRQGLDIEPLLDAAYSAEEMQNMRKDILANCISQKYYPKVYYYKTFDIVGV